MGWKERGWYFGPSMPDLFDRNGNAGPLVFVDGSAVGAWAQRRDGQVVTELLEPVSRRERDGDRGRCRRAHRMARRGPASRRASRTRSSADSPTADGAARHLRDFCFRFSALRCTQGRCDTANARTTPSHGGPSPPSRSPCRSSGWSVAWPSTVAAARIARAYAPGVTARGAGRRPRRQQLRRRRPRAVPDDARRRVERCRGVHPGRRVALDGGLVSTGGTGHTTAARSTTSPGGTSVARRWATCRRPD